MTNDDFDLLEIMENSEEACEFYTARMTAKKTQELNDAFNFLVRLGVDPGDLISNLMDIHGITCIDKREGDI